VYIVNDDLFEVVGDQYSRLIQGRKCSLIFRF